MKPRELVYKTLEFKNDTGIVPRTISYLNYAEIYHKEELSKLFNDFPEDILFGTPGFCSQTPPTYGNPNMKGIYIDEWCCTFENLNNGAIGEVKNPIISDDDYDWEGIDKIHIPVENLTINQKKINEYCAAKDEFLIGGCCPRPFEQLQFIRGTENLYCDLITKPDNMLEFIGMMHKYYSELLTLWAQTDIDCLFFMDDWGCQKSLLINPNLWCEIFKPMYKDYIDIAHSYGKKILMHSDGYILEILPHLVELGLDAVNAQLFCMDFNDLQQFKGKITFWGEIDRQHMLPNASTEEIAQAVKQVKDNLWQNGGCVAQCEFGLNAKPENVYQVYKTWSEI
ncbi:MAG: uroporphyrinogen decarboxylase family protein [Eubacteriales bacterium]|nr:uroporphyrinogen decarboxylase family protein [Eubacteriales bacterium]